MGVLIERAFDQRADFKPPCGCLLVAGLLPNKRSEAFWTLYSGSEQRVQLAEVCTKQALENILGDGRRTLHIRIAYEQKGGIDDKLSAFCGLLNDASIKVTRFTVICI
jgi:hypothetical protein